MYVTGDTILSVYDVTWGNRWCARPTRSGASAWRSARHTVSKYDISTSCLRTRLARPPTRLGSLVTLNNLLHRRGPVQKICLRLLILACTRTYTQKVYDTLS